MYYNNIDHFSTSEKRKQFSVLHQVPKTVSVPLLRIWAFQVSLEVGNFTPESHQVEVVNVTFASHIKKLSVILRFFKLQGVCVFTRKVH